MAKRTTARTQQLSTFAPGCFAGCWTLVAWLAACGVGACEAVAAWLCGISAREATAGVGNAAFGVGDGLCGDGEEEGRDEDDFFGGMSEKRSVRESKLVRVLSRCAAVRPTSTGTARLNGRAAHY